MAMGCDTKEATQSGTLLEAVGTNATSFVIANTTCFAGARVFGIASQNSATCSILRTSLIAFNAAFEAEYLCGFKSHVPHNLTLRHVSTVF
jgi:hypothetical protein